MTAKKLEQLVRTMVEPLGVTVLSDDGITVFRAEMLDGWCVNLRKGEQYVTFCVDHKTIEADVITGVLEAVRGL